MMTMQETDLVDAFHRVVAETDRKTGFRRRATKLTDYSICSAIPHSFMFIFYCWTLPSLCLVWGSIIPRPQICRFAVGVLEFGSRAFERKIEVVTDDALYPSVACLNAMDISARLLDLAGNALFLDNWSKCFRFWFTCH